jgi:hypothetical protein
LAACCDSATVVVRLDLADNGSEPGDKSNSVRAMSAEALPSGD